MAENKKINPETNAAAETAKASPATTPELPPASCLTLRQKLVEMRKACPEIIQQKHSDGVSYKYAKIYDVWEKVTPIMNELGVDFDIVKEEATQRNENGDPVYWITMNTKTQKGDRLMFLYEADLTIRWSNIDNDEEVLEAVVHAVGWNDDPAKAKGPRTPTPSSITCSRSSPSTKAPTILTTAISAHRPRATPATGRASSRGASRAAKASRASRTASATRR